MKELTAICLEFLPPDVTATMQPLDQSSKRNWRSCTGWLFFSKLSSASKPTKNTKLFYSMLCTPLLEHGSSLSQVVSETASKRHRKQSFAKDNNFHPALEKVSFEDFVNTDRGVAVCGPLTTNEILCFVTVACLAAIKREAMTRWWHYCVSERSRCRDQSGCVTTIC